MEFEDVGVVGSIRVVGLVPKCAGFGREAAWREIHKEVAQKGVWDWECVWGYGWSIVGYWDAVGCCYDASGPFEGGGSR